MTSALWCGARHAARLGRAVLGAGHGWHWVSGLMRCASGTCFWSGMTEGPAQAGTGGPRGAFVVTGWPLNSQKRCAKMGISPHACVGGQPRAVTRVSNNRHGEGAWTAIAQGAMRAGERRAPGRVSLVWVCMGTVYFWSGWGPQGRRCFWSEAVCGGQGWRAQCDGCICRAGCLAGREITHIRSEKSRPWEDWAVQRLRRAPMSVAGSELVSVSSCLQGVSRGSV